MAAEGWDEQTGLLIDDSFTIPQNQWVRDVKPPFLPNAEGHEVWREHLQ